MANVIFHNMWNNTPECLYRMTLTVSVGVQGERGLTGNAGQDGIPGDRVSTPMHTGLVELSPFLNRETLGQEEKRVTPVIEEPM